MKKNTDPDWKDRAAGKIAGTGIRVQRKIADNMNKKTANIPARRMKWFLLLFCMVWGGFSFYFIGEAIVHTGKNEKVYKIEVIHSPKHFDDSGEPMKTPEVDDKTYRQIQAYKRYMDSTGQPVRSSLMDTILLLEELYKKSHNK